MTIDVKYIAQLCKLRLEDDKIEEFEHQMRDILSMVDHLPAMDNPLQLTDPAHPMELRSDTVGASLTRDELLQNAPRKQAGCFVVPRTV